MADSQIYSYSHTPKTRRHGLWIYFLVICLRIICSYGQYNCTIQGPSFARLPCVEYAPEYCSLGKLKAKFPGLYQETPNYVSAEVPEDRIQTFCTNTSESRGRMVRYRPADGGSITYLKGFEVLIRGATASNHESRCRVIDLESDGKLSNESLAALRKVTFSSFFPGAVDKYFVYVIALPKPSREQAKTSSRKFVAITAEKCTTMKTGRKAVVHPNLTISMMTEQAYSETLTVNFTVAGETVEIADYTIDIIHDGVGLVGQDTVQPKRGSCVTKVTIIVRRRSLNSVVLIDEYSLVPSKVPKLYEDMEAGNYTLMLTPVDPYYDDPARCFCYEGDNTQIRLCTTCEIYEFNIEIRSKVEEAEETGTPLFIPILGSVAALITCLVVVFVTRRGKFRRHDVKSDTCSVCPPPKKIIYLMYAVDNKKHYNVVERFAHFLQTECNCDVIFPAWSFPKYTNGEASVFHDQLLWINNSLRRADHVIIVNSEMAYYLFESKDSVADISVLGTAFPGEIFIKSVKQLLTLTKRRKVSTISVCFEYTKEEHIIKEFNSKTHIRLMIQSKELLEQIHGPKQSLSVFKQTLKPVSESRDLLDAAIRVTTSSSSNKEQIPNIDLALGSLRPSAIWEHQIRHSELATPRLSRRCHDSGFDSAYGTSINNEASSNSYSPRFSKGKLRPDVESVFTLEGLNDFSNWNTTFKTNVHGNCAQARFTEQQSITNPNHRSYKPPPIDEPHCFCSGIPDQISCVSPEPEEAIQEASLSVVMDEIKDHNERNETNFNVECLLKAASDDCITLFHKNV